MRGRLFLASLLAAALAPVAPAAEPTVLLYRLETSRQGVLWAADHPLVRGDQVTFHQHPGGTLVSLRRSEIRRVVAERFDRAAAARAGSVVDVGVTGGGAARAAATSAAKAPGAALGPGARPDGSALLNPDRKYQPDVDSKQVPGLSLGYPASPNDYREGRTFGYPAAPAVQAAPGEPPKMPEPKGK